MTIEDLDSPPGQITLPRLTRWVLCVFLLTFLMARLIVLLIMTRRIPDLYLHLGGTHIHHLNYGIFLLSGVGGYLLWRRPNGKRVYVPATIYAVGLALTFDEFGMWIHLGGPYWQRASFDAVVIIAAILFLITVSPSARRLRPLHGIVALLLVVSLLWAGWLSWRVLSAAERGLSPRFEQIERQSPV